MRNKTTRLINKMANLLNTLRLGGFVAKNFMRLKIHER